MQQGGPLGEQGGGYRGGPPMRGGRGRNMRGGRSGGSFGGRGGDTGGRRGGRGGGRRGGGRGRDDRGGRRGRSERGGRRGGRRGVSGPGRRIGDTREFVDEVTEHFEPQMLENDPSSANERIQEMKAMEYDEGKAHVRAIVAQFNESGPSSEHGLDSSAFTKRPGFGQQPADGRLFIVVNWFTMAYNQQQNLYHYDLLIKEGEFEGVSESESQQVEALGGQLGGPTSSECRKCVKQLSMDENWPGKFKFDGRRNVYTTNKLDYPDTGTTTLSVHLRDGKQYSVRIKYIADLSLQQLHDYLDSGVVEEAPYNVLQALEVVMSDNYQRMDKVRRNFFWNNPEVRPQLLGGGFEVWFGFRQALRLCQSELMLNIDLAHQPYLREITVAQFITQFMGDDFDPNRKYSKEWHLKWARWLPRLEVMWRDLKWKIKAITVVLPHLYAPQDSERFANFKEEFEATQNGGQSMSCPKLPLIELNLCRGQRYNEDPHPLVPPEALMIVPGQRSIRPPGRLRRDFPRIVSCTPPERMRRIQSNARKVLLGTQDMTSFGVAVRSDEQDSRAQGRRLAVKVRARTLPPPVLVYGNRRAINPGNTGEWQLTDPETGEKLKFASAKSIQSWGILSFVGEQDINIEQTESTWGIKHFAKFLVRCLKDFGVEVVMDPKPPIVYIDGPLGEGDNTVKLLMEAVIEQATRKYQRPPDIILVALPAFTREPYEEIKYHSVSQKGILTQCFVAPAAGIPQRRPDIDGYCRGVAQKMNAKLGGYTSHLMAAEQLIPAALGRTSPYMFIGIDTSKTRTDPPKTVVAMTASMDKYAAKFVARITVQDHHHTQIQHFAQMLNDHLQQFRKQNKKLPDRIVFFRDGVSQGQFKNVIEYEYNLMQDIFSKFEVARGSHFTPYNPNVTYIVMQKSHNTLFFADRAAQALDTLNVYPGTVTDQRITDKKLWDFYMTSHKVNAGTARPVHYFVLLDENRFSADLIQLLTYWMCYNYCRSSSTTVAPIPTNYARLASRQGMKIQTVEDRQGTGSQSGDQGSGSGRSPVEGSSGSGSRVRSGIFGEVRGVKIHENLDMNMWYA